MKNERIKRSTLKTLQKRQVATHYLSNIPLKGSENLVSSKKHFFDQLIHKTYFDDNYKQSNNKTKLVKQKSAPTGTQSTNEYNGDIQNFKQFLAFNDITTSSQQQNEYFKHYQQKLRKENPNSSRQSTFLQFELKNVDNIQNASAYLDKLKKKKQNNDKLNQTIEPKSFQKENIINLQVIEEVKSPPIIPIINITTSRTLNDIKEITGDEEEEEEEDVVEEEQLDEFKDSEILRKTSSNNEFNGFAIYSKDLSASRSSSIATNSTTGMRVNKKITSSINTALNLIQNAKNKISQRLKLPSNGNGDNCDNSALNISLNDEQMDILSDISDENSIKTMNGIGLTQKPLQSNETNPITIQNSKDSVNNNLIQNGSTNQLVVFERERTRTCSESSNDSRSVKLSSSQRHLNYGTRKYPYLMHTLRRLNNEKVILSSNSGPFGIFSRIPYKMNLTK
jgi:hypothetical protein